MSKKLLIYLDFDGVLNNIYSEYYKEIQLCKNNISYFVQFLNKLEYEGIEYNIVLNTSWKLYKKEYFVEALYERLLKEENPDLEIKKLFSKFKGSLVTPSYDFGNYQCGENYYNCKSFEVESFIAINNLKEEEFIHFYLDDEIVDFKYINILQYNTNPELGFIEEDIEKCYEIIKKEIENCSIQ